MPLLALVYGTLFGIMCYLQHRRPQPAGTYRSAAAPPPDGGHVGADCLCGEQSGLSARQRDQHEHFFPSAHWWIFSGVLILSVQHEQLQENALHSELAAMDEVLHRQYEQYKRSKEGHQPHQPAVS